MAEDLKANPRIMRNQSCKLYRKSFPKGFFTKKRPQVLSNKYNDIPMQVDDAVLSGEKSLILGVKDES